MTRLSSCSLFALVALAGCGDDFNKGEASPDAAPGTDGGVTSPFAGTRAAAAAWVTSAPRRDSRARTAGERRTRSPTIVGA